MMQGRDSQYLFAMFPLHSVFSQLRLGASALASSSGSGGVSRTFTRHRSQLAPRKVKWPKRQKGTIPIPIGGSTKGTTLAFGEWGIRIKGNGARFSAKQLQTVEELMKRKLKVIKGAKVFLRIFPDVPVCIKVCILSTNETAGVIIISAGKRNTYGQGQGHI